MTLGGLSRRAMFLLFSMGLVIAGLPAQTVAPDEVVLKVGNTALTAAEFEKMVQALPPEFSGAIQKLGKRGFAQQYASLLVLAQEGQRRKLDQQEKFEQMAAFGRMVLLSQLTVDELARSLRAVSPEEVNYYYGSHKEEFEQVKLRAIHIPFVDLSASPGGWIGFVTGPDAGPAAKQPQRLTESQAKAKAASLSQRIRQGANMAELARKESQHPTASSGGNLGYVRREQLRDQFAPRVSDAIFALEPRLVSVPMKHGSGFYLFLVEEKRLQSLEDVRTMIENSLRQQKLSETVGNLTQDTLIEFHPKFFEEQVGAQPPSSPVR